MVILKLFWKVFDISKNISILTSKYTQALVNMDKGKGTMEYHSKRPKTVPIAVNFEGSINFLFIRNFYV